MRNLLDEPGYAPERFMDWLIHDILKCRTDAALARELGTSHAALSNIRHRRKAIGPSLLVRASELTDLPIRVLKEKMGLRVKKVIA